MKIDSQLPPGLPPEMTRRFAVRPKGSQWQAGGPPTGPALTCSRVSCPGHRTRKSRTLPHGVARVTVSSLEIRFARVRTRTQRGQGESGERGGVPLGASVYLSHRKILGECRLGRIWAFGETSSNVGATDNARLRLLPEAGASRERGSVGSQLQAPVGKQYRCARP